MALFLVNGYAPLDDVLKGKEGYLDIYNSCDIEDAFVHLFPHIPHDVVDVTAMHSFLVCVNISQDYIPFRHWLVKMIVDPAGSWLYAQAYHP